MICPYKQERERDWDWDWDVGFRVVQVVDVLVFDYTLGLLA